jgi:CheY-like chemotaxis protein
MQAFQKQTFDVVLMDVQMPGVDGLEATRRIRHIEATRDLRATPIVALTASVMEEDRRDTRSAGMDGFASKPIDLPHLFAEIARVLGIQLPHAEGATSHAIRLDHSANPAIDWVQGTDLWGNAATLGKAIRRFLDENQPAPQQIAAHLHTNTLDAARYLAHRLRGAAGNLCLPTLLRSAAALEDTLKSSHPEQARLALEDVSTAIAAVYTELAECEAAALPATTHPTAPLALAQCHSLVQTMLAATQRNEWDESDEATLAQLGLALRNAHWGHQAAALESALVAFEFDTAQQLLESLRQQLPPYTEEPAPCTPP